MCYLEDDYFVCQRCGKLLSDTEDMVCSSCQEDDFIMLEETCDYDED